MHVHNKLLLTCFVCCRPMYQDNHRKLMVSQASCREMLLATLWMYTDAVKTVSSPKRRQHNIEGNTPQHIGLWNQTHELHERAHP